MIPRLYKLWLTGNIGSGDDFCSSNEPHSEASLVKVVYIIVDNAIFDDCILYLNEPITDDLWLFHLSLLAVILVGELSLELIMVLY